MDENKITQYLDRLVARGIPSVDCIVYDHHKEIYRHMCGTVDGAKEKNITGQEKYLMFSMTKVQTMTAVMQLVEQGRISLEDPVSKYLPAYAKLRVESEAGVQDLEEPMLVKHLLSMQSGLDYDLSRADRILKECGGDATTRQVVESFAERPLKFIPGQHFLYSLSHDVAAAIVEVVSGMRFGDYLRKNIWEPLHMENTFFSKTMNDDVEGLATQFVVEGEWDIKPMTSYNMYQLSPSYESGGAGLISTTEDYAVFADTIACGGVSRDGARIIKAETIELMKKNLLGPASRQDIETTMGRRGYGYGCGVQVLLEPEKVNSTAPAGVFGWDGAAGACITMDTKSGRSLVYIQHVRNCGMSYGEIHPTLRDMVFGKEGE